MKILFVCKYNRFRSKVAEAFFKKLNKNKKHSATSAGIFKGNPISKEVKNVSKKLKIVLSKNPRGISSKLLKASDLIVIVADNVPKSIFSEWKRKRAIIIWKIKDMRESNMRGILKSSKDIEKKVIKLVENVK